MSMHVSELHCSTVLESAARPWARGGRRPRPALIAGALLALGALSPALAADAAADAQGPPTQPQTAQAAPPSRETASGTSVTSLQEVIVTGTRFKTPNASSPAPITIVGAADLLHQGTARAEELMNSLPQVNTGLTDTAYGVSQFPVTGTATIDLRGIGAFRTLVLMNGRRINPGDAVNPSADLHTIPEVLIKRVEVLTGGASAIYGSDAEAGVVNFVMDDDFVGSKLVVQGNGYYGDNNNTGIQSIMRASGVNPPTGSVFDGTTVNVTGVYGTNFAGQSGHILGYAGYRHNGGILRSSRDFSDCTLQEAASSFICQKDGVTPGGQFLSPAATPGTSYTLGAGGALRPFDPNLDGYNPAPLQSMLGPDSRYIAGVFGHFRFNEHALVYLEGQFTYDHNELQYEPSGTTATLGQASDPTALLGYQVPCNDPLLSAAEVSVFCTQTGLGPTDVATIGIGRRNVEGGPVRDSFRHTSFRTVLGVKGEITEAWTYDGSVNYGKVTAHERLENDLSVSRLANALNVMSVGGTPTCISPVDMTTPVPGCVPYNIWIPGGVTPAALDYLRAGGTNDGYATQAIATLQAVGDLGRYGWKSPWAADGLGLAVGAEYRNEVISTQPSESYLTGDLQLASALGLVQTRAAAGSFHVSEAFAELKLPLLKDRPFTEALNLDLADRIAEYSPQGTANAYNLGGDWAPIRQLRFRASYSRAVRAPNGHELYVSQQRSVSGSLGDPCSGSTPTDTPAQCAYSGVTAAQYGRIPVAPTYVLTGGNPGLRAETANDFTTGIVLTNFDSAPSLLLSVDYWRIRISGYLGQIPASTSLDGCLINGDPTFCALVVRDPVTGSLGLGSRGYVSQVNLNTARYGESGVDIAGQYSLSLRSAGTLTLTLNASRAIDNPITVYPGAALLDCIDLYGPTCSGSGPTSPVPKWRHNLRTTWTLDPFEVSLNWRFIGALSFEGTSKYLNASEGTSAYPTDSQVGSYSYFDLDTGYDITKKINLHLGVNNLFDKKPPLAGVSDPLGGLVSPNPGLINGNLIASFYDPFGREIFAELTARF
jgi:iron complex outermembrane recepter protein